MAKISLQCLEARVLAFAWLEAQLHQSAGCVVDEDQQCARFAAPLEPTVLAAVDLNQLADLLPPQR